MRVKGTGRFICKEKLRFVYKCACDCDSLLLTAGELVWNMMQPFCKANLLSAAIALLRASDEVPVTVMDGKLDVFKSCCTGYQIEVLKYKPYVAVSDCGEAFLSSTPASFESRKYLPLLGLSRHPIIFRRVDFLIRSTYDCHKLAFVNCQSNSRSASTSTSPI